jgi:DNA-binding CsgD family transcriptional regulator/PAS domain-containing protein
MELPERLGPHASVLYVYRRKAERIRVVQSYVLTGVERDQGILVLADDETNRLLRQTLSHADGDQDDARYRFVSLDEQPRSQPREPQAFAEQLRSHLDLLGGHSEDGIRIVVDLQLVAKLLGDSADLAHVSEKLASVVASYPVTLLGHCSVNAMPRRPVPSFLDHYTHVSLSPGLLRRSFAEGEESGDDAKALDLVLDRLALSDEQTLSRVLDHAAEGGDGSEPGNGRATLQRPRFLSLVEEIVLFLDAGLRIRYISPSVKQYTGRAPDAFMNHELAELTGVESAGKAQRALSRVLQRRVRQGQRRAFMMPFVVHTADGCSLRFEASVSLYLVAGEVHGYLCMLRPQADSASAKVGPVEGTTETAETAETPERVALEGFRGQRSTPPPHSAGGGNGERHHAGRAAGEASSEPVHRNSRGVPLPYGVEDAGSSSKRGAQHRGVNEDDEQALSLRLTSREFEIIQDLLEGYGNREIGEKLNIAEVTVKKHLTNIYRKLGVRSRYEVMKLAR